MAIALSFANSARSLIPRRIATATVAPAPVTVRPIPDGGSTVTSGSPCAKIGIPYLRALCEKAQAKAATPSTTPTSAQPPSPAALPSVPTLPPPSQPTPIAIAPAMQPQHETISVAPIATGDKTVSVTTGDGKVTEVPVTPAAPELAVSGGGGAGGGPASAAGGAPAAATAAKGTPVGIWIAGGIAVVALVVLAVMLRRKG